MSTLARLPGLDGLRGVAVLAVIAYHLQLGDFWPAGFLGVDIFFTVSGFIITALLLQEQAQTGRIDFAAFYLRRARRLFPAASVMLLGLVALTPWLLPDALPRLVEDLPAALLYLSNWWQIVAQQSYFEAIEQPRLLKHLWSLAVEEQYYLLWPLVALGLLRQTGKTGLGLGAGTIAVASTAWMAWLYVTQIDGGDPSRVYLGTDTHLMGLLTGSALAAWWNPWQPGWTSPAQHKVINLAGAAALAALVWGMAQAHEGMPGLYQGGFLAAAVLTAWVIVACTAEGTWVARWLSTRPMLWLGARSYSLYLWHWPMVIWFTPGPQADMLELAGINATRMVLTLVCAEASYRWVEKPWVSGSKHGWGRRTWLGLTALVLVNVAVLSGMQPLRQQAPSQTHTHSEQASLQLNKSQVAVSETSGSSRSATTPNLNSAGPADQELTLVGDSVMLGASPYLLRRWPAARIEAKVGRQGSEGLKLVQNLRAQAQLGDAAVIHLGTNGYLGEAQFRALLAQLADRQTVVVLNVYGARRWTGPNNALIARISQDFDNVRLVDWHAIGQNNPAYFVQDGIHLSSSGIHAYYQQIRIALGQPEVMVTEPAPRHTQAPQRPPSRPPASPASAPSSANTTTAPMAVIPADPLASGHPSAPDATERATPATASPRPPASANPTSASEN
ncbi:acyltransferase family protein [Limnohabitans sp. DCL3]|uniref:acyltransferase family protein n=1 Tax=Limnohabitans sp. DCL3 TaxID=3374103 RepID=UPI003A85F102